ncbi:hypothetical protein FHS14_006290 [Paenibacillus baekrokdamisoli]|nr:hypothetical protein [Paenibacillus baekrokdamisoli]
MIPKGTASFWRVDCTYNSVRTNKLTVWGEQLQWFARHYLPADPRPYTSREVRPDIAFIRFDYTDFDQAGESFSRNGCTDSSRCAGVKRPPIGCKFGICCRMASFQRIAFPGLRRVTPRFPIALSLR